MAEIKTVMIVGAGTMGSGIAQAIARKGYKVLLIDKTEDLLDRARKMIQKNLSAMVSEQLYTAEESICVASCIEFVPEAAMATVAERADLVIESVFEDPEVKKAVFAKLDKHCRPDCIYCSNTSASNVFDFVTVSRGEHFLIMHWFNPAYLMELVEVVKGPETADLVMEKVRAFLIGLGKKPCVLNQYIPGFIVNRLANALCREAGYMITQGWTTAKEIDEAIRSTSGIRYAFEGPMALNDVVGWDLILAGCHDVFSSLCNASDTSEFAEGLVEGQKLGVKTKQGVYDYSNTTAEQFLTERSKKIIKMYKAVQSL
jgi:3-hydroxybutyryl-CoA dehydrogenase